MDSITKEPELSLLMEGRRAPSTKSTKSKRGSASEVTARKALPAQHTSTTPRQYPKMACKRGGGMK
eukprot:27054-Prorocentrum_minimum.AAC.1